MSVEKLPAMGDCPFCRSADVGLVSYITTTGGYVECRNDDCGAYGPSGETDADAIQKWNAAPRPAPKDGA